MTSPSHREAEALMKELFPAGGLNPPYDRVVIGRPFTFTAEIPADRSGFSNS